MLRPGRARAPLPERQIKPGQAAGWLKEHRHNRKLIDQKTKLRVKRTARQKRDRLTSINAPLLKRIKRQERTEARFEALRESVATGVLTAK